MSAIVVTLFLKEYNYHGTEFKTKVKLQNWDVTVICTNFSEIVEDIF